MTKSERKGFDSGNPSSDWFSEVTFLRRLDAEFEGFVIDMNAIHTQFRSRMLNSRLAPRLRSHFGFYHFFAEYFGEATPVESDQGQPTRRAYPDGLALIFCDIVDFKKVNDFARGQMKAGDKVIEEVGEMLAELEAEYDQDILGAFHLSGDEFTLIVNSRWLKSCASILQDKFADFFVVYDEQRIKVELSFGAAVIEDLRDDSVEEGKKRVEQARQASEKACKIAKRQHKQMLVYSQISADDCNAEYKTIRPKCSKCNSSFSISVNQEIYENNEKLLGLNDGDEQADDGDEQADNIELFDGETEGLIPCPMCAFKKKYNEHESGTEAK